MSKPIQKFNDISSVLSTIYSLLSTNWGTVMSAALATILASWESAVTYLYQPNFQVGVMMFVAFFWTYIGVIILYDRTRPKLIKPYVDFAYGLTFDGVKALWSPSSDAGGLQFVLAFRNYSQAPIKYTLENFDVRIGSRAVPKHTKQMFCGFIPRGGGKLAKSNPLKIEEVKEFFGKKTSGIVEFTAVYGPIDGDPVRRLHMRHSIEVVFGQNGDPFGMYELIEHEEEEEIISPYRG